MLLSYPFFQVGIDLLKLHRNLREVFRAKIGVNYKFKCFFFVIKT